jgi:hypothetical protein
VKINLSQLKDDESWFCKDCKSKISVQVKIEKENEKNLLRDKKCDEII